jgi:hypothetical protein
MKMSRVNEMQIVTKRGREAFSRSRAFMTHNTCDQITR